MASQTIRPAAVAGHFYPAAAGELAPLVDELLAAAAAPRQPARAIITPHAGLMYSGKLAARAWRAAARPGQAPERIVLLGPSHRVYLQGLATSSATHWQSPLGLIALDTEAAQSLLALPQVCSMDAAHAQEHSLEVQLPLIQQLYPQARLLPLVVGDAGPGEVAEVLEQFWGQSGTLIAISSDLSHFHPYREAQAIDAATAAAIEACAIDRIGPGQACGCRPLNGLLLLAGRDQLEIQRLALRNSGDAGGGKDRVVGYGAFALH